MRTGKLLAFRLTCTKCRSNWIMMRDKTWNVCCIVCGDKQTTKDVEQIWIEIDKCTEFDQDVHFED